MCRNKVNCSLTSTQRPGHLVDNCKWNCSKKKRIKAPANEETLLRKHCFLAAQTRKHLLKKQNVSEKSQKHFLFFRSKTCFRSNVSSFAGALKEPVIFCNRLKWFLYVGCVAKNRRMNRFLNNILLIG